MAIRVAQIGTGNVGVHSLTALINNPDFELTGVWVSSDSKAGKDAAELAHTKGIKVFLDIIGPGDSCEGIKQALALGADAIQTDMPDRAGKCLKKN